jgi:hypothetical protein
MQEIQISSYEVSIEPAPDGTHANDDAVVQGPPQPQEDQASRPVGTETKIFKNVSRYTTPEEQAQVERIDLDPEDLDRFMDMLRSGLLQAAAVHDTAVQRNFALSAETSIRLSRPVYNAETDLVEQHEGKIEIKARLKAHKVYKQDPEQ